MTAIYIIIAILIPLAILLCSPFKIYVSCINNKFSIKIRYLFLKKLLLPNKKNNLSENKNVKEKNKRKRNTPYRHAPKKAFLSFLYVDSGLLCVPALHHQHTPIMYGDPRNIAIDFIGKRIDIRDP